MSKRGWFYGGVVAMSAAAAQAGSIVYEFYGRVSNHPQSIFAQGIGVGDAVRMTFEWATNTTPTVTSPGVGETRVEYTSGIVTASATFWRASMGGSDFTLNLGAPGQTRYLTNERPSGSPRDDFQMMAATSDAFTGLDAIMNDSNGVCSIDGLTSLPTSLDALTFEHTRWLHAWGQWGSFGGETGSIFASIERVEVTAIPLKQPWLLAGMGLLGVVGVRSRRR